MTIRVIFLSLYMLLPLGLLCRTAAAQEGVSNFDVVLLVDGQKRADTWINLSDGGSLIEIPAAPVLSALANLVDASVLHKLESQMTPSGTLTNKILAKLGISLSINGPMRQVSLRVKSAPKPKPAPIAPPPEPAPVIAETPPPKVPAKVPDDSGPWATPPVPALPTAVDGESASDTPPETPPPETEPATPPVETEKPFAARKKPVPQPANPAEETPPTVTETLPPAVTPQTEAPEAPVPTVPPPAPVVQAPPSVPAAKSPVAPPNPAAVQPVPAEAAQPAAPVPAAPQAAAPKAVPPKPAPVTSVPKPAQAAPAPAVKHAAVPPAPKPAPVAAAPKQAPDSAGASGKPAVGLQSYQFDRTRDELFEDVFKHKPPPLPAQVEVTLLVDGKSYGTLWLMYNKEQKRYTFPVDPVLNALQGLVRRELWEKLARRANTQSRFTVEDLIECGFPTVLNTTVFELSTGVPAQLLGTKLHPLAGQTIDPYAVPAYEPSWLSAFVNTRIKERVPYYQYNPLPTDTTPFRRQQVDERNQRGREPVIVNWDGAVNLKAWVLEGKADLWEKQELNAFEASRQDIRLVHDWPKQALRLTAGDLIFPTSGFESFLKMGGIGLSRDFSLQPQLVAYPVKDFEFFLNNPSEVKIFINGALRGTYQMDPGTHDLQGFSFTTGESEVEVLITDNTGQTQTLSFSFIHEPSLLAKGNTAFSFNVGLPSRDTFHGVNLPKEDGGYELMNYEYDTGHPILFLDYRRGMSDLLTMEAYSQALDTAGMFGVDALRAMKKGKMKIDAAGSYHKGASVDWAGNLEYTYIPKITANVSPLSFRVLAEYFGPEFYRPSQDTSLLGSLTVAGSLQMNAPLANFNIGGAYTLRPHKVDFYDINLGLTRNWGKGWSTSLSLKNTFDRFRSTNTLVAATFNYYFNVDAQSLSASERIENHRPDGTEIGTPPNWDFTTDLNYDYNGSAPFPSNPSVTASTSFGPSSNDYNGLAQWRSDQGILQIQGRRYEPKLGTLISNYLDLTLQSGLVFAGGNFAMSRPITDGFVLVKGIENEKDCDILVNANPMGYDSKAAKWLPGVIPSLSAYYLKKVHLDVQNPPFGANDERSDYTLYPGYKSGYSITTGSRATIIALGTLLLAGGAPAEYQTFTATPLDGDGTKQDPFTGFTNKAGKFQMTRMQPGRYKVEADVDGKLYSVILTLPKNTAGIKSVGTLILTPK